MVGQPVDLEWQTTVCTLIPMLGVFSADEEEEGL
jgi:hypothetical protein